MSAFVPDKARYGGIAAGLRSSDRYDQGDVGPDIFDYWYKVAAAFAKGSLAGGLPEMREHTREALRHLFALEVPGLWLAATSDDYVIKSLTNNLGKLVSIFRTKPKFTAMCLGAEHGRPFVEWMAKIASATLEPVAFGNHVHVDKRTEVLTLMTAFLEFGVFLAESDPVTYPEGSPFSFNLQALVMAACQPSADMLLRDAALRGTKAVGASGGKAAEHVAEGLIARAQDATALEPLWGMGVLRFPAAVEAIEQRCAAAAAASASPAQTRFPFAVLQSLYEAVINYRTSAGGTEPGSAAAARAAGRRGSGGSGGVAATVAGAAAVAGSGGGAASSGSAAAFRDRAGSAAAVEAGAMKVGGVAGTAVASHGGAIGMFAVDEEEALCRVLAACDTAARNVHRDKDRQEDDTERSNEMLELLKVLLEDRPDSERLLDFAVFRPTVDSVAAVSSLADFYTEHVWTSVLLPFASRQLDKMSEAISGSQFDQEIVNLVREGLRVYYLNSDRPASPHLGRALFRTTLKAIQHGYSETERFPALAASVLHTHIQSGSATWLADALDDELCARHATVRSMSELVMSLLALESSSFGVEAAAAAARHSDAAVSAVLAVLADTRTNASNQIWHTLCMNYGSFVAANPRAVGRLLGALQKELRDMMSRMAAEHDYALGEALDDIVARPPAEEGSAEAREQEAARKRLEKLTSTAEVLRALAMRVTPEHAPALLDLTLQTMALLPRSKGTTLYSDEVLALIVAKVSDPDALPPSVASEARRAGGVLTRTSLAALFPVASLRDRDPDVRIAALRALAMSGTPLMPGDALTVLRACPPDHVHVDLLLEEQGLLSHEGGVPMSVLEWDDMVAEGRHLGLHEADLFRAAVPVMSAAVTAALHATAKGHPLSTLRSADLPAAGVGATATASSDASATHGDASGTVVSRERAVDELVGLLSAVVGRLLRAAHVTAMNDAQNRPLREVSVAFERIVAQVSQELLLRLSTTKPMLHRLHKIAELSPSWAALVVTWVEDGKMRHTPDSTKTRKERRRTPTTPWGRAQYEHVSSADDFEGVSAGAGDGIVTGRPIADGSATLAGRSFEMQPVMAHGASAGVGPVVFTGSGLVTLSGAEAAAVAESVAESRRASATSAAIASANSVGAATAVDPTSAVARAGVAFDAVKALVVTDPVQALRQAVAIYRTDAQAYTDMRVGFYIRDNILPAVGARELPAPTLDSATAAAVFSDSQLDRYDAVAELVQEMAGLVGGAANEVLRADEYLAKLGSAAVLRVLRRDGPDAARAWMTTRGIHDPAIATAIDGHAVSAASAAAAYPAAVGAAVGGAAPRGGTSHGKEEGKAADSTDAKGMPDAVLPPMRPRRLAPLTRLPPPPPAASSRSTPAARRNEAAEASEVPLIDLAKASTPASPSAATATGVAAVANGAGVAAVTVDQSERVWEQLQSLRRRRAEEAARASQTAHAQAVAKVSAEAHAAARAAVAESGAKKHAAAIAAVTSLPTVPSTTPAIASTAAPSEGKEVDTSGRVAVGL